MCPCKSIAKIYDFVGAVPPPMTTFVCHMLTIENKLIIKSAFFLSDRNALQQRFLNFTKVELFYTS